MLGWSMNLFRIRGIQLSIHASFLLLVGYVAWEGWREAAWTGAAWSIGCILALFACVTLHELGHAVAARRFGINVPRILLLPIGGMAEMDAIPRRPREEIIIALAGPAVNCLIVGVLLIFVRLRGGLDWHYIELTPEGFGRYLVLVNGVMAVFNLLPAFPMDGGRVFRALLATRLAYSKATRIAVGVGKILAITGATFLVYKGNYLGGALFFFIIFAGERELRSVIRLEQAAACGRGLTARLPPPPPAEPPARII